MTMPHLYYIYRYIDGLPWPSRTEQCDKIHSFMAMPMLAIRIDVAHWQ